MTSHTDVSARHMNAYHHNNSLLFQFIIVEFIECFEEIQHLDVIHNRKIDPPATLMEDQKQLTEQALARLVGSTRDYMRIFSWNFGEGILAKLKTYCALFLQNAPHDEKEIIALQHYADRLWQACMQAMDTLHGGPSQRTAFLQAIDKAITGINRMSKLIARIIPQFRDDENVVFCILRHKERFDKLYGGRFVFKLLSKMYAKGLPEAQNFISKRYTERGFNNLLPIIAAKMAEIENAAL